MELNKCSRKVVQKKVGKSLRKLWIKNVSQTISDDLRLVAALLLSANNFVRYDILYHFYFSEIQLKKQYNDNSQNEREYNHFIYSCHNEDLEFQYFVFTLQTFLTLFISLT